MYTYNTMVRIGKERTIARYADFEEALRELTKYVESVQFIDEAVIREQHVWESSMGKVIVSLRTIK